MLIDEVTIRIQAGNGGNGRAAFSGTKMTLGPTGGSGGNGGNVYLEGVADIGALNQFRFKKKLFAENGEGGQRQNRDGHTGEDMVLKIPVGTVVHDLIEKTDYEILAIGERVLVAHGGRGGKGNYLFRSPTNTSPKQFEEGKPGTKARLKLELKLIADVGFIGLPNVGKSSLLNELTNAKSRVANYPFTTLEPNLGAYYDLILADIPGLIEGAASGKGLGDKFLRHVERTRIVFHLISTESQDPELDYATVRNELELYNAELLKKKEYLFLSKCDNVSPKEVQSKIKVLKKLNPTATPLSIHDPESIEHVQGILNGIAKEKHQIG